LSLTNKPFSKALSDIEKVVEYLTPENKEGGSSFRAIARNFPTMLQSEGLIVSVSFLYSKAGEELHNRTILQKGAGKDATDPKKLSGVYLKLVLEYLGSMIPLQQIRPLDMMKELVNDSDKMRTSESLLAPYVVQLKMLSEAVFGGEEGEEE
jgi:CRISPR type III-B/RAMP module-associated protein Cmr5